MPVPEAALLIELFDLTQSRIERYLNGLTHAHSLVQPPFNGNCINWVVGHLLTYRQIVSELLGGVPVIRPEIMDRYRNGSAPIKHPGEEALTLEEQSTQMIESHRLIKDRLETISTAELEVNARYHGEVAPLRRHLYFLLVWHETYHTGQLDQLREMALEQIPA